ncbi:hypothetical protein [Streptomyces hundungensis]|uniref:hypothetical protein n=1 Tax=Streptomyces hundungensis TaxID=1077946 RepID=UPI0033D8EF75
MVTVGDDEEEPRRAAETTAVETTAADGPLAWCLVANVGRETSHGEGGLEIRSGLRHFSPGALVWLTPPLWGDGGERMRVTGRRRNNRWHYVSVVIRTWHLENYRVKGIYAPSLLSAVLGTDSRRPDVDEHPLWASREQAQQWADRANRGSLPVHFRDVDYETYGPVHHPPVSDPPPLEVGVKGRVFHLAHFNARRAVYSPLPPPVEPALGPESD